MIVPVRNEGPGIAATLSPFVAPPESELLIADGSEGSPASKALAAVGARIIAGNAHRGGRLALAAREARGDVFFFLHADSRPPAEAIALIRETLARGAAAGAFSLGYSDADGGMRWIAWWGNLRSRLLRLPFGDQGIFCRREAYEKAGGFRDWPVCDDVDLVRRLRRAGRFEVRREKTETSPRRYRNRGALRQVLTNWKVLAGYYLGVSPETLARWYSPEDVIATPTALPRGVLERKSR